MNQVSILNGKTYLVVTSSHGNFNVLIDSSDIERVQKYTWSLHCAKDTRRGFPYFSAAIPGSRRKRIKLHRYLIDCPPGMIVDHINQNTLDNRKSNLRIVDHSQNRMNNRSAKNYSRCPEGWRVDVVARGVHHFGGRFKTEQEASEAARALKAKLHVLPGSAYAAEASA